MGVGLSIYRRSENESDKESQKWGIVGKLEMES
jgi:hypothetical protein